MTPQEKLAEGSRLKDEAGAKFKAGNFKGAASTYARVRRPPVVTVDGPLKTPLARHP